MNITTFLFAKPLIDINQILLVLVKQPQNLIKQMELLVIQIKVALVILMLLNLFHIAMELILNVSDIF